MNLDKTYTLDSNVALKNGAAKLTITSRFCDLDSKVGYFEEELLPAAEVITAINEQYNSITHTSRFVHRNMTIATLYHDEGRIEFYFDFPAITRGEDNIEIEFETKDTVVTPFRRFLAYADHILVMYDEVNEMVIYSDYNELAYFPLSNYAKVVTNAACPIGDSVIALFTNNGVSYLKRNTLTLGENNVKYAYSLISGKPGTTALAPNAITTLANDVLFLANTGVHALSFGDNVTSNERYALERSAFINPKLAKHEDLSKAIAVSHNNKLYIAIEGAMYVADARYKTSPRDQDMSDTFNYEWWCWDNIPVKEFFKYKNKLYFISDKGYICEFTEDRTDEEILMLSEFDVSKGYFSAALGNDLLFQLDMNFVDWVEDGNIIQQNQLHKTKKYIIDKANKYTGTFQLKDYDTEEYVTNDLYLFGYDETIYDSHELGYYKEVFLSRKRNVVSEWYTPVVDMGTSLYSKNLIGSTLTFEPDVEGNVKFGYLTRRSGNIKEKESNLSSSEGVDFDNLDFTDFSFAVNFACSRTLKTRVRNYNYIQFRIVSDNNKDCALNNFVVTYTIGRKNKGVR